MIPGKKHYFLESRYIFRRILAAGFYCRYCCCNYFYYFAPLFKTIKYIITWRRRSRLSWCGCDKLKMRIMLLNTAMVSVATAFVGVISFMGLIVPHVLRLLIGSDNKKLLPASMILGALLLVLGRYVCKAYTGPCRSSHWHYHFIGWCSCFYFPSKTF